MENTFFWHDYETFGINPKSDRPAQFAGIRTDMNLNEIDKPIMVYCKPTLDALPSPISCLITGITPQLCDKEGLQEYAFAALIEKELAKSGTIGLGYNSIRFDDEVTRFLFWRNLIDPYSREWRNDCSRWDLLDVIRALYALRPESITWPRLEDGTVSFKLEALSAANGLKHEKAHDALSDVYATIGLARLIKSANPKFFEFCLKLRMKKNVLAEMSLEEKRPLIHVSGMYGFKRAYLSIIWPLASHPTDSNKIIAWDLSEDPSVLETLSLDEIKNRLFTASDDLPKNISRLPIKTIGINRSPFVIQNLKVLTPQRAAELEINLDLIHKHVEIAKNLKLQPTLWSAVYHREFEKNDVDEDLYGAFIPNIDRSLLERLRSLDPIKLSQAKPIFEDSRLKELLFRYRARNFPHTLNAEEMLRWQNTCSVKLQAKLNQYQSEMLALQKSANTAQLEILSQVNLWIEQFNLLFQQPSH